MAKKIGDVAIGLIILLFLITSFSQFLSRADEVTGVDSDLNSKMTGFETSLGQVRDMETSFTDKIDVTAEFGVSDTTQIDDTTKDSGGLLNLFSKNVLVRFFSALGKEFKEVPASVWGLIASLIAITITIVTVRFFQGETKV